MTGPLYVSLYLQEPPRGMGCGQRQLLVIDQGHKWTTLLYIPMLKTIQITNDEFARLLRKGRTLEYQPKRLAKHIRDALRHYEKTNAVRDALALLRAEKITEAPKEDEMVTKKKAAKKKAPAKVKTNGEGGARAAELEAAKTGKLPTPPPFSKPAYKPYLPKLAELKTLVRERDVKKLKAYPIPSYNSIVKALDRYRNLAVIALEAKAT